MSDEFPAWLSTTEAASYLGVSDKTILGWVASGAIPALRQGRGIIRIPRDRLADAAMQNLREPEEVLDDIEAARRQIERIQASYLPWQHGKA